MITRSLWAYILSIFCYTVTGQHFVGMVASTDSVTIGEPLTLNVTVSLSGDTSVEGILDFSTLDTLDNLMYATDTSFFNKKGDIAILPGGSLNISSTNPAVDLSHLPFKDWGGEHVLEGTIVVAFYDVGQFKIPNPKLNLPIESSFLPSSPPIVNVYLPRELQEMLQDSIAVAPIKPIFDEPLQFEDFKLLLISLGILIAAVMLVYFTRIKKRELETKEVKEEIIPAHLVAMQKLDVLKSKELWQKGKIKEYQSELTFIIREYLENQFNVNALEMTTDEILKAIPDKVDQQKLRNILQIADMVKFAKAKPPADIHNRFLEMAYEIIKTTIPIPEIEDD